jgi:hypothetical protein
VEIIVSSRHKKGTITGRVEFAAPIMLAGAANTITVKDADFAPSATEVAVICTSVVVSTFEGAEYNPWGETEPNPPCVVMVQATA